MAGMVWQVSVVCVCVCVCVCVTLTASVMLHDYMSDGYRDGWHGAAGEHCNLRVFALTDSGGFCAAGW